MTARTVSVTVVGDASSAKKALDDTGTAAESSTGRIGGAFKSMLGTLNSTGVLGPFGEAIEKIQGSLEGVGETGKSVGTGIMAAGGAVLGVGLMAQQIGSKDKEAQQQLQQAIENTGHSWDDYKDHVEQAIKSQEKYGNTASETQNALQILTQATNDPAKALQYLGTASDLAAAKHISLATAATALGKAYNGSTKLLKEFGLEAGPKMVQSMKALETAQNQATAADDAATKAKQKLIDLETIDSTKKKLSVADEIALRNAHEAVSTALDKQEQAQGKLAAAQDTVTKAGHAQGDTMTQLAEKLNGQASAAADSFSGRMRALKAEVEDTAAKLGQKYGPALTAVGAGMTGLGAAMDIGTGLMKKFQGVQQDTEAAAKLTTTATEAMTAAQEASTTATEAMTGAETAELIPEGLALAPILLIIAALAALVLGGYELVTHWKEVWAWVQSVVSGAIDWVSQHWPLILAILTGPFGLLVLFVKDHFQDILNFLEGIPGDLQRLGESAGKGYANGWIWGINAIIGAWDAIARGLSFTLPSWIPGIGGDSFSLPTVGKIPYLDTGGIAYGPMVAALSQNNVPEAVTTPKQLADFAGYVAAPTAPSAPSAPAGDLVLEVDGNELFRISRSAALRGPGRGAVRIGLT